MKLLQITGKRAFTATAALLRPINNLVKDENVKKLISSVLTKSEGDNNLNIGISIFLSFLELLPDLLEDHSEDIINMFAIIQDIEPEEYENNLTVTKLFNDINELRQDEDLLSLFFLFKARNIET